MHKSMIYVLLLVAGSSVAEECQMREFDVSSVKPGHISSLKHLGHTTIRVYHRTNENINELNKSAHMDLPKSLEPYNTVSFTWPQNLPASRASWASKGLRSFSDEYFVYWDDSPHNDCELGLLHFPPKSHQHLAESEPDYFEFLGEDWPGGFFDACYGVAYNYAGIPIFSAFYDSQEPDVQLQLEKRAQYSLLVPEYTIQKNRLYLKTCKSN
ncbi:hypothetical protein [Methylophaga sp.]|uniref:hypothetical protein n=1 Tax=Methylophaga sp. TaxID=2024840 RepID=UPI000C92F9E4|nr:hypothetical protein [Methylophaga sp.]MAK66329.1 hypothetical protein [Methylophaga sp.]